MAEKKAVVGSASLYVQHEHSIGFGGKEITHHTSSLWTVDGEVVVDDDRKKWGSRLTWGQKEGYERAAYVRVNLGDFKTIEQAQAAIEKFAGKKVKLVEDKHGDFNVRVAGVYKATVKQVAKQIQDLKDRNEEFYKKHPEDRPEAVAARRAAVKAKKTGGLPVFEALMREVGL